jgi:DNA-binding MarR family transcriptional regulator
MSHPAQSLDEVVHQRNRLAILAMLRGAHKVEFTFLQRELDLTGGNLSRHIQVLEDAGLVQVEKGYLGKRPRTWVQITRAGAQALASELELLKRIVASIEHAEGSPAGARPFGQDDRRVSATKPIHDGRNPQADPIVG